MRVNEIFYSLQGEGRFSGTAAIFIRLAGCNLRCVFCDTRHEPYKELAKEEILRQIAGFKANNIVFTGGEPALQLDADIIRFFKAHGYYVQVETNGTRTLPVDVDWVTCSPKGDYCGHAEVKLKHIDEVKVVFDGKHDPEKYLLLRAKAYYLQPCDVGDSEENKRITHECVEYILAHPQWNLSLQTQKILNVR